MFNRKQNNDYGPAAQRILDYIQGKSVEISSGHLAMLSENKSGVDCELSEEDRDFLDRLAKETAFNERYVLRSEYNYRIKRVRSEARWELGVYMLILVIMPLLALLVAFWPYK